MKRSLRELSIRQLSQSVAISLTEVETVLNVPGGTVVGDDDVFHADRLKQAFKNDYIEATTGHAYGKQLSLEKLQDLYETPPPEGTDRHILWQKYKKMVDWLHQHRPLHGGLDARL